MEELELEKKELESLIGKGVQFEVRHRIKKRAMGLRGLLGRKESVLEVKGFMIKPPTLAVMDRLSLIGIDLEIEDREISDGENTFELIKGHIAGNVDRLAEYVATAALGEDYYIREQTAAGRIREYEDEETLRDLTRFFKTWLTAPELHLIAKSIILNLNLTDFIASMRLLKGTRTAKKKDLIES